MLFGPTGTDVMRRLGLFLVEEAGLIGERAQRDRKCPGWKRVGRNDCTSNDVSGRVSQEAALFAEAQQHHLHSALEYQTPAAFAARCFQQDFATLCTVEHSNLPEPRFSHWGWYDNRG